MRGPVVSSRVARGSARSTTTSTVAVAGGTHRLGAPRSFAAPALLDTAGCPVSTESGSTAFVMSCSVSPAIATAVSASISTPVCPWSSRSP